MDSLIDYTRKTSAILALKVVGPPDVEILCGAGSKDVALVPSFVQNLLLDAHL